ncbi:MAG: V4R domain-containing protein [Longimicrobiaceae bacterium]
MPPLDPPVGSGSESGRDQNGTIGGTVAPFFPLILLETLQDMDRPEETIEGEDLSLSMPRRFGFNDVVYTQINRFREEVRRKRQQESVEVENLIRLVVRRPDAEEIFTEAGRRIARRFWDRRAAPSRLAVRALPRALALLAARRATRRMLRQVVGSGSVAVKRPLEVRIDGCVAANADPGGAACALYAGAVAELAERYTGKAVRSAHPTCEARGGGACEWTVSPES